jgi:RNA polymerase sigma-70 factor (ECF subfamily)
MSRTPPPADTERLLEHRHWVRALARSLVRDGAQADDVEQETWLAALRSPPRAGSDPRAWLGTVLRNWVRRGHRSEGRRNARERAAARPDHVGDTAELADRADAHQRVVSAVLELPASLRDAVLLRYFEDLSVPETARRMGVPYETARSRLRLAFARLRGALEPPSGRARSVPSPALLLLAGLPARPEFAPIPSLTGVIAVTATEKLLVAALVVPCLAFTGWVAATSAGGAGISREEADALVARVAELEQEQERRQAIERGVDEAVQDLGDRIARVEYETNVEPTETPADPRRRERKRSSGPDPSDPSERQDAKDAADERSAADRAKAEALRKDLIAQREAVNAQMAELGAKVKTMTLRRLPTADRWSKAVEAVGLHDSQVDAMKRAIDERDRAIGAATVTDVRKEGDEWVKQVDVDEEAVAEAERIYAADVNEVLDDTQRPIWHAEGFGGAFGKVAPRDARTLTTPPRDSR